MRYWDTSTLAKLYFNEPDSNVFANHLGFETLSLRNILS
jgi:hypothetical protein